MLLEKGGDQSDKDKSGKPHSENPHPLWFKGGQKLDIYLRKNLGVSLYSTRLVVEYPSPT
jgi:hypothetical protein